MDNSWHEISGNVRKCKLLCANKVEKYKNCDVFFDLYSTVIGNIKVTECYDLEWLCDDCLRCALVDDAVLTVAAAVAFSCDGDGIKLKIECSTGDGAICYPFAIFAVLSLLRERRGALL